MSKTETSFVEKARKHWTTEREAKVTGGKKWPIRPSEAPELLRVIGLLNGDGSMSADSVKKFSQINHMVTQLMPTLEDLAKRHPVVRVLDACCGTSYLTLLIGWVLKEKLGVTARIVGVDANAKVVETSKKRAEELGMSDRVKFVAAKVDEVNWEEVYVGLFPGDVSEGVEAGKVRPHLLVSLHACDVATDHAMALGVRVKADAMAVAPCCQAELANKWKELGQVEHPFSPVFRTPNLRRDIAAQMTDTMRMLLARSKGYEVTASEFVPSAHTPKNRLLLCTRRGSYLKEAADQYREMKGALGGQGIKLEELVLDA